MDVNFPVNALDDIISKLESTFVGSLHIQDDQKSEHVSEENNIGNCHAGEGHLCGCFEQEETKLEMKCLKKCSTFPDVIPPSSSSDKEANTSLAESLSEQSPHQSYSCFASLPEPSKLVSAMKGSREKQGGSQMKMTVKWAPDVYDPAPTLVSHTVKNKKPQKSRIKKGEKKNGKKGQKSYKRQYRYRLPEYHGKVIEASTELNDLAVSHDSYNGVSNSKQPATEALTNIYEFVSYIKTA